MPEAYTFSLQRCRLHLHNLSNFILQSVHFLVRTTWFTIKSDRVHLFSGEINVDLNMRVFWYGKQNGNQREWYVLRVAYTWEHPNLSLFRVMRKFIAADVSPGFLLWSQLLNELLTLLYSTQGESQPARQAGDRYARKILLKHSVLTQYSRRPSSHPVLVYTYIQIEQPTPI